MSSSSSDWRVGHSPCSSRDPCKRPRAPKSLAQPPVATKLAKAQASGRTNGRTCCTSSTRAPCMHLHVLCQVSGRREGLAARRALVRPLACVHPHVHSQVLNVEKALPHVEHSCFLLPDRPPLPATCPPRFLFCPARTSAPPCAGICRISGSPSRTSSAQSPFSKATPHTALPLISFTRPPGYHTPSYCSSTAAW